jgi:hypothetical protein
MTQRRRGVLSRLPGLPLARAAALGPLRPAPPANASASNDPPSLPSMAPALHEGATDLVQDVGGGYAQSFLLWPDGRREPYGDPFLIAPPP